MALEQRPKAATYLKHVRSCFSLMYEHAILHLVWWGSCRDALVTNLGTIKLADFGLSKSLPRQDKHVDRDLSQRFELTGETGSYRYMVRLILQSLEQPTRSPPLQAGLSELLAASHTIIPGGHKPFNRVIKRGIASANTCHVSSIHLEVQRSAGQEREAGACS